MRPPDLVPRGVDYLRMVASRLPALVVATALSFGVGVWIAQTSPSSYEAHTHVFVVAPESLPTYLRMATSTDVLTDAIVRLDADDSVADLRRHLTVTGTPTDLAITLTGQDRGVTRDLVNAVTAALVTSIDELDPSKDGTVAVPVDLADDASPDRRNQVVLGLEAALAGLAAAVLLTLALEVVRGSVVSRRQLDAAVHTAAGTTR